MPVASTLPGFGIREGLALPIWNLQLSGGKP
jgi:hypothetical protein